MTICILGRQPEIGLAELEALYGFDQVIPVGQQATLVKSDVDFDRLGGTVKTATLLEEIPSDNLTKIFKKISQLLPEIVKELPTEGKVKLGLSLYGFDMSPYAINGEALKLKKVIRRLNRSVRVVPNDEPALSSAQTFHNSLTSELGLEFVIVADGPRTFVGRVAHVQDINAYRTRDRNRPKRDAFVGMLPPKLAQIVINLAAGHLPADGQPNPHTPTPTVLDPFCGTGVILQEAHLMGYNVYGSDLSPKMVDYSRTNLDWLTSKSNNLTSQVFIEQADATSHTWQIPTATSPTSTVFIACETDLGQPLGGQQPSNEKIQAIVHSTNKVIRDFLKNIAPQLKSQTRLCLAIPAWFIENQESRHLPVLNELANLGYKHLEFRHAPGELIYRRADQVTARELVVLEKI